MQAWADGNCVILWMDEMETAKEVRRWLIIKKMRMTNHATKAFKVRIETGRGIILEPILSHRVDAGLKERRVEEWA
jgi:KaiC.